MNAIFNVLLAMRGDFLVNVGRILVLKPVQHPAVNSLSNIRQSNVSAPKTCCSGNAIDVMANVLNRALMKREIRGT